MSELTDQINGKIQQISFEAEQKLKALKIKRYEISLLEKNALDRGIDIKKESIALSHIDPSSIAEYLRDEKAQIGWGYLYSNRQVIKLEADIFESKERIKILEKQRDANLLQDKERMLIELRKKEIDLEIAHLQAQSGEKLSDGIDALIGDLRGPKDDG